MSERQFTDELLSAEHSRLIDFCKDNGITLKDLEEYILSNPDITKDIKRNFEENKSRTAEENFNRNNLPIDKIIVMDTSICGVGGIITLLNLQKEVIVLDVVIRELNKLRDNNQIGQAKHATLILKNIASNFNPYRVENVPVKKSTTDETIINYCELKKHEVILLTADMEMAALAKSKEIKVCYFDRKPIKLPIIANKSLLPYTSEIGTNTTLEDIEYICGKLYIRLNYISKKKRISVFSGTKEYKNGRFSLKIGQDILIVKQKEDYIAFSHYEVISNTKYMNCKLVYGARIINQEATHFLPEAKERYFMKNFFER